MDCSEWYVCYCGILSLRYASRPGVPLARMAGRGFLNGLPVNTKALYVKLCVRGVGGGGGGNYMFIVHKHSAASHIIHIRACMARGGWHVQLL